MRNVRRLVIVLIVLLVLGGVFVGLLPTLVNAGLGQGVVRDRLAGFVSGDADFDSLTTSWSGEQRIDGLVLTADDGVTRVDVDVVVRHGLLELLGGIPATVDATVSGSARGRVDASGRPSFDRLPAGAGDGDGPDADGRSGGSDAAGGPTLPFGLALEIDGMRLDLDFPGPDGDRPLALADLRGRIDAAPGTPVAVTLASPTEFDGADGSVRVELAIDDLVDAAGRLTPLAAAFDDATIELRGVPVPTDGPAVFIESLDVTGSGELAGRLEVSIAGAARVDGAETVSRLEADAVLDGLVRDGTFDVAGGDWTVTVDGVDVPTGPLDALVPALAEAGVDLREDVGESITLTVAAGSAVGAPLSVDVRGAAATLTATGETTGDGLIDVRGVTLDAIVRPSLLATHMDATLDAPLPVRVTTEPFVLDPAAVIDGTMPEVTVLAESRGDEPFTITMPGADGADPTVVRAGGFGVRLLPAVTTTPTSQDAASMSIQTARATLRDLRIDHPASAEAIEAPAITTDVTRRRPSDGGPDRFQAVVQPVSLRAGGAPLGTLTADASAEGDASVIAMALTGTDPATLERVLATEPAAISGWTRGMGDLTVRLEPGDATSARIGVAFPGLEGDVDIVQAGGLIDVDTSGFALRPSPERVADLLKAANDAGDGDRLPLRLEGDLGVIADLRLVGLSTDRLGAGDGSSPLAAFTTLDLDATTTPMTLVAGGTPTELPALAIGVETEEAGPIALSIGSAAASAGDGPASPITANLRVLDLVQDGVAVPGQARLDGTIALASAPSQLLDTLFGTDGLIGKTLGPSITADLTADGFGRDAGSVALAVVGERGRIDGTVRGESGAFIIEEAAPLVATVDLHPVLRDEVLASIQPIFGGVSETDGPFVLTVTDALVPLSDGVSAATVEFKAEAGTLRMQPNFDFLALVALFDRNGGDESLEARIEPVTGRLIAGRIETDATRLVLTKGASIDFAGGSSVDLVNKTVDVRASMPLKWLGSVFREAQGIADSVTVPLLARGPTASAKLQVDPSYDVAGALLEAGVNSLIERELERAVPGLGDLLRGLGGGRKDDGGGGGGRR